MQREDQLLEKRLLELSRISYNRDILTFSDFLNLNELNILHTLPKNTLYTGYVTFGGYELAERQIAAFIPDALSLREEKDIFDYFENEIRVLQITPIHAKFAEELSHRDYLGAMLNLGIDRSKTGDILITDKQAIVFVKPKMCDFLKEELTRIKHTTVMVEEISLQNFNYQPKYEEVKGTVASVRLDSLLSVAFSSSRSSLVGLIEGGKVFVNGKLITSNGYQVKEQDIISVRGMGKFQFCETLNKTKKNRIYVRILKYV